jgi:hypothetical protein
VQEYKVRETFPQSRAGFAAHYDDVREARRRELSIGGPPGECG